MVFTSEHGEDASEGICRPTQLLGSEPCLFLCTHLTSPKHSAAKGSAPATRSSATSFLLEEFGYSLCCGNSFLLKANRLRAELLFLCRLHVHCRGILPPGAGTQTLYKCLIALTTSSKLLFYYKKKDLLWFWMAQIHQDHQCGIFNLLY